jgi:hypothetical protein
MPQAKRALDVSAAAAKAAEISQELAKKVRICFLTLTFLSV